ncbi:hypothetical protein M5X00_11620 [Paenibacillus alvei]|uniref:Uncharacterized protein n=1 Tax=Paenibacillus alvei TaxID=44250 RepID=A0AAP6ZYG6_PAEAL|nr:hypothetical protein [Paenibacillus alvei]EJW16109.1 hypothetical protein PAV_6c01890 [Paenibacillus alvei DSM 29]MBG9735627.1 hypothetical protein [Paenibacillus alvei]MBG9746643.1 hypothetical protein [Paenibacillus alvei]MCY7482923.1 hypothetical protein [Paenibacillus alvei]MCY9541197.1 hypothetical protein [Paenibacillus alvei]
MSGSISIWALKKMPMQQVIQYIEQHSSTDFQARMTNMQVSDYEALSPDQAQDELRAAISTMNEEHYTDYLLELIDE